MIIIIIVIVTLIVIIISNFYFIIIVIIVFVVVIVIVIDIIIRIQEKCRLQNVGYFVPSPIVLNDTIKKLHILYCPTPHESPTEISAFYLFAC